MGANKYGYSGKQPVSGGFGGNSMQSLMKQAQQMQAKMQEAQQQLEETTVEGTVAGGLVTVVCNGKKEILSVSIKPEAQDPDDVEMLEDLVMAAINDAYSKASKVEEQLMAPFAALKGMM
ncbi:MAG: YbaB/EbfC family nucleoid-associated protein [Clostridia bacterium]|nr:YbaB/EbfC family nucleoid-associated protein [Clostridia bacterium]